MIARSPLSASTGHLMLTRSSSAKPDTLPAPRTNGLQPHARVPVDSTKSVISIDLKIVGTALKIISKGILQIDGEIEGDVQAPEIIVGEHGKVTGTVVGEHVLVRGKITGVIRAKRVSLQASSKVEGEIRHMSFAIEEGALFEGRSRRVATEPELNLVLDGKTEAEPKVD